MQDQSPGVRLLAHGGVAVAWCCQDKVIFKKRVCFCTTAVFLVAFKNDAQLIFIRVPVITVIHDAVRKAAQMDIFTGQIHFIISFFHRGSFLFSKILFFKIQTFSLL